MRWLLPSTSVALRCSIYEIAVQFASKAMSLGSLSENVLLRVSCLVVLRVFCTKIVVRHITQR